MVKGHKEKDPRFAAVNYDPRFHNISKKEKKVKIGNRFKAMIEDKERFDNADDFYYLDESQKQENQMSMEEEEIIEETDSKMNEIKEEEIIEEDSVIRNEEISKRLAMQNYDWKHMKAPQIYQLFYNILEGIFGKEEEQNYIDKVEIYLSNFGKEQLEIEKVEGPKRALESALIKKGKKTVIDEGKLRKYEQDRLKYYFAVIHFNSAETAEKVYDAYDGYEIELSGCKIDLRFIPDEMEIPNDLTDSCDTLPDKKSLRNTKFFNRAMGHSQIELTWDKDDRKDAEYMFEDEEINKDKLQDIVALDNEESNELVDDKEAMRKLLLGDTNCYQDFDKRNKKNDIEITFEVGFGDNNDEDTNDKDLIDRRREYDGRNNRRNRRQLIRDAQRKKQEKQEANKKKAELELLVDFKTEEKEFKANPNDKRFNKIKEDSKFAIDPTHPNYNANKSALKRKKQLK